jgi:vacuolar protein sorting-associated protein 53
MKMDSLLKTLQVRPSPPEALVQAYLIHIGDRSEANFRRLLELKGLRKAEHAGLVDLFNAHCNSTNNAALPASSPFLAAVQQQLAAAPAHPAASAAAAVSTVTAAAAAVAAGASLKDATASAAGRFDPATLGNALMSAAREGVDRLGTPTGESSASSSAAAAAAAAGGALGLSASPALGDSAATTTATAAANINENLKNFGKFFRREGGAFGRFGRASTAPDGGGAR